MSVELELGEPDQVKQDQRGYTARWLAVCELAPEHGRPRVANVVLSVYHAERRGYRASLMNEAEGSGMCSVMFDFRTNAAVELLREPAARMSRKRLREILAAAVAETQRRFAEQDERVRALWHGIGCC